MKAFTLLFAAALLESGSDDAAGAAARVLAIGADERRAAIDAQALGPALPAQARHRRFNGLLAVRAHHSAARGQRL